MNTGLQNLARSVFMDSGLAPSARPGMTSGLINRIAYYTHKGRPCAKVFSEYPTSNKELIVTKRFSTDGAFPPNER